MSEPGERTCGHWRPTVGMRTPSTTSLRSCTTSSPAPVLDISTLTRTADGITTPSPLAPAELYTVGARIDYWTGTALGCTWRTTGKTWAGWSRPPVTIATSCSREYY